MVGESFLCGNVFVILVEEDLVFFISDVKFLLLNFFLEK